MKKLYVDTFLKEQSPIQGQSRPLLIQASDGNQYFIKNNMVRIDGIWVDENAVFFNEVVSHRVSKFLGIPTPDIAVLEIESDIMSANSDLLFERRFKKGLYFGSRKIEQAENNLLDNYSDLLRLRKPYILRSWNSYFNNISNPHDISLIIAMDLLLANFDRFDNTGNLLVGQKNNERTVFALDHGHCFQGPLYDTNKEIFLRSNANLDIEKLNAYINNQIRLIIYYAQFQGEHHVRPFNLAGSIFKAVEQHVDVSDIHNHSFTHVVARIEQLTSESILQFFADIPDEWIAGGQAQIKSYSEFIYRQSRIIRYIIQRMVTSGAFSNYRGGTLSWEQENLTGTQ